ncbi:hypothetical protein BG011_003987 [Mortierella polycephala]|uniref:Uncharacterized protein n=1 Tax=Mortierella polycephala TaxID=41804 RepID=A0A9P6QCV6_9FUNG|nr:hypothetical protein BG011_003987 [Mortierella polycephala]
MPKYNRLQIAPAVATTSLRSKEYPVNHPNRPSSSVLRSAKKHLDDLENALTTRSEIMAASLEQKSALQLGLWKNRFEHRLHQSTEQILKDWKITKKTVDGLLLTQDQAIQKNSDNFATFKLRTISARLAPRTISRIAPRVVVSRVANYSSASSGTLDAPGSGKEVDPKIVSIVDQISGLTLLQTADLVSLLKTRLNIQEIAMPVGGAGPAGGQAAAAEPVEEEKVAEKTEFNVKLEKFDAAAKAKLIREIKNIIPGINLVEAKKFVEGAPKIVKEGLNKADAEKLKKTLEDLGATVSLE